MYPLSLYRNPFSPLPSQPLMPPEAAGYRPTIVGILEPAEEIQNSILGILGTWRGSYKRFFGCSALGEVQILKIYFQNCQHGSWSQDWPLEKAHSPWHSCWSGPKSSSPATSICMPVPTQFLMLGRLLKPENTCIKPRHQLEEIHGSSHTFPSSLNPVEYKSSVTTTVATGPNFLRPQPHTGSEQGLSQWPGNHWSLACGHQHPAAAWAQGTHIDRLPHPQPVWHTAH